MTVDSHSRLKRALEVALSTVSDLREQLADAQGAKTGDIAIVGMACRFPGGVKSPEDFWKLLCDGANGIQEIPPDRWDVDEFYSETPQTPGKMATRWGGFIDDVDSFDFEFFDLSRREAAAMDPQHRLFLETAWEALEDAGCSRESLSGSHTGVFASLTGMDHASQLMSDVAGATAYTALGGAHSLGAGRLSYFLDLHGPNLVLDAACASSLVAVHQASASLRSGESDLAVCAAASTILIPTPSVALSQLNQSFGADGTTKSFDAAADGFGRSEGLGAVVLKRLEDAERDGGRVLAVIRGSGVNHDGRSAGLTAPNGKAQAELMRRVLKESGIDSNRVAFIETHGTGTKMGDPIEFDALKQAYGRAQGLPVYLGAVKSNIGHAEAAAGMAGLIKTVLSLQHATIPANLHFSELNPLIDFTGTTFQIPTEATPWPEGGEQRLAAVSAFGLNGTNAHIILENGSVVEPSHDVDSGERLLVLSARSNKALRKLARRYADLLKREPDAFLDIARTAGQHTHWEHRLAVTASTGEEAGEALSDLVRGAATPSKTLVGAVNGAQPPVAFLFSGMGSQYPGMGQGLDDLSPKFREALDACDELQRSMGGPSVRTVLWPSNADEQKLLDDPRYVSPAVFALEIALAETWRAWGVEPAAVMGHSLGEYAAMTFAGALTLDEGFELVFRRSELLAELPATGGMLSVYGDVTAVRSTLGDLDDGLAISAINGPTSITLSGLDELIDDAERRLDEKGLSYKRVQSPRPGHCALVEPMLRGLRKLAESTVSRSPQIPLVTNTTGTFFREQSGPDAEHWADHARGTVRFGDGIATLAEAGCRIFIEVGPSADALGMALDNFDASEQPLMLSSLRRKRDGRQTMNAALARLYVDGADIDWQGYFAGAGAQRVPVPSYPFDPVHLPRKPFMTGPKVAPPITDFGDDPAESLVTESLTTVPDPLIDAATLRATPEADQFAALVESLSQRIRQTLGHTSEGVQKDVPLAQLGLDSLLAIELKNEIETRLHVEVSMTDFLGGATIEDLARSLQSSVAEHEGGAERASSDEAIIRRSRVDEATLDELLTLVEQLPDDGMPSTEQEAE